MHPVYGSALTIVIESFGMLRDAVADLPDEATGWVPAADTNSAAVLTNHCITSSRFWLGNAAGEPSSITEYRGGQRAESFAATQQSRAALLQRIDAFVPELEPILARGTDASLAREIAWPDAPDDRPRSGAEALFHSVGHLREHVGQVELLRDLWLGRDR